MTIVRRSAPVAVIAVVVGLWVGVVLAFARDATATAATMPATLSVKAIAHLVHDSTDTMDATEKIDAAINAATHQE